MRALIFAAGHGKRMGALSRHCPKPLLRVADKSLIEWQIERLKAAGIEEFVINLAKHSERIRACLGDGSHLGVSIRYSEEGDEPLDTGGGMLKALPLLGDQAFLAINADVWCEADLRAFRTRALQGLAHLVLVPNPPHHPAGDFGLLADGRLALAGGTRLTFAGMGLYRPQILAHWEEVFPEAPRSQGGAPIFPLGPLLRRAALHGLLRGECCRAAWTDVGTVHRLRALRRRVAANQSANP